MNPKRFNTEMKNNMSSHQSQSQHDNVSVKETN